MHYEESRQKVAVWALTNEDDASMVPLRESACKLEDASNGFVRVTVPLALDRAGLDSQEEGIALLGKRLQLPALSKDAS